MKRAEFFTYFPLCVRNADWNVRNLRNASVLGMPTAELFILITRAVEFYLTSWWRRVAVDRVGKHCLTQSPKRHLVSSYLKQSLQPTFIFLFNSLDLERMWGNCKRWSWLEQTSVSVPNKSVADSNRKTPETWQSIEKLWRQTLRFPARLLQQI